MVTIPRAFSFLLTADEGEDEGTNGPSEIGFCINGQPRTWLPLYFKHTPTHASAQFDSPLLYRVMFNINSMHFSWWFVAHPIEWALYLELTADGRGTEGKAL